MNSLSMKWFTALAQCACAGNKVIPQCFHKGDRIGRPTRELLGYMITFQPRLSLADAWLEYQSRKLSQKFALGEAAWILSGSNRLEDLLPYAPKMADFSDNGITLFGAYGVPFLRQVEEAVEKLVADHECRQSVISIWRENPFRDGKTKDVPCTLSWQFVIREGELHMFVNMRSNDVWLGLPYDIFSTTCVQWYVALRLRECGIMVTPGKTFHSAASMHLYEDDMNKVHQLIADGNQFHTPQHVADFPVYNSFSDSNSFYQLLTQTAHACLIVA